MHCSWVTPDTKITRWAKQLVGWFCGLKVISRTSPKRIVQNGRKVLHASFSKINQITFIWKTLQAKCNRSAVFNVADFFFAAVCVISSLGLIWCDIDPSQYACAISKRKMILEIKNYKQRDFSFDRRQKKFYKCQLHSEHFPERHLHSGTFLIELLMIQS